MTIIAPLAPAARSILFALETLKVADEAKVLGFVRSRGRGEDAARAHPRPCSG